MIDQWLELMARQGPDHPLNQLEPAVWNRITKAEEARRVGLVLTSWRSAAIALALTGGVAAGSAGAASALAKPAELSAFSVKSSLAPSTLLSGRHA